jgi:integrase
MLRERAKNPEHRTAADWACFLILTGARSRESSELLWQNVSIEAKRFTFVADTTKTDKKLELPMSDLLRNLLRDRMPDPATGYVFATASKTGHIGPDSSDATWAAITKIAGTPVNRHDLRRTFVDICDECDIDGDRQRILIGHKAGGDVHARHYRNSVRMLPQAVAAIAAWVQREADLAAGRNVVPLRATAQAG